MVTPDDESVPREAVDLIATLTQAMSDDLARTNERLRAHEQRQSVSLAKAYVRLYREVVKASEVVTTRRLERILDVAAYEAQRATDIINRYDEDEVDN